jgi:cobalt ECF transporter T component CbiQ
LAQSSFVERTLVDINHRLEQSFFAENIARQKGLLQRFDPRAKLIAALFFLIAVGSARQLWILAVVFAAALVGVNLSEISLFTFIKRVCLLVLVFTSLIALPALFITPGPALWTLPGALVITRTGAQTAAFLLLRVTTSISLATLLILTTPWNDVLKALGVLHLPDVIVLILAMTYRYIHLLLHEADDMFTTRKSRILKNLSPSEERDLLGATGGVLLSKSLQLSGEVYLAMQSRGYHHYPRTLDQFEWRWWDTSVVVFSLIVMMGVFILA